LDKFTKVGRELTLVSDNPAFTRILHFHWVVRIWFCKAKARPLLDLTIFTR
jgi:hypothetical protein